MSPKVRALLWREVSEFLCVRRKKRSHSDWRGGKFDFILGMWKLKRYRFRMNGYVPTVQLFGSFQSTLKVSFFWATKRDTLLINGIDQAGDGAHAFPVKITGPMDDRIDRAEQIAVP